MHSLLWLVPKNYLSFFAGKLAGLPLPALICRPLIEWFVRKYEVNTQEIAKDISEYPSLGSFFVRELTPGCRVIGQGIVSPVDGTISEYGTLEDGKLLQVKGREYSAAEVLSDSDLANLYIGGYFITFYLSPRDYHHIHAPVRGVVERSVYVKGNLWPVNSWSVRSIDRLYAVNERVISVLESKAGKVCVVKVGALNVGSISVVYDDFVSNSFSRLLNPTPTVKKKIYDKPKEINCGEKLGTFNLGSTVILFFQAGCFLPSEALCRGPVKMGQSIGSFPE